MIMDAGLSGRCEEELDWLCFARELFLLALASYSSDFQKVASGFNTFSNNGEG